MAVSSAERKKSSSLLGFIPLFRKLQLQRTSTYASSHSGIEKKMRIETVNLAGDNCLVYYEYRREKKGLLNYLLIERDASTMC